MSPADPNVIFRILKRSQSEKETYMKKQYLALTLVTFAIIGGTPALAQSFSSSYGTGNVLPYTFKGEAPTVALAPMATPGPGIYMYVPEYNGAGEVSSVKRPHKGSIR
jgi:hypothetical protein